MVRKSLPLAQQVVQEILSGIQAGDLVRADDLLPSEAELSRSFDVSRATIREALSRLEQRGIVYRRHGVGTFISPQRTVLEAGFEKLESLRTLARRMGLEIQVGDLEIVEREASYLESECLQIQPGAQVLSVARVILTGDQPVAYLIDVLPVSVLHQQDLGKAFDGSVLDFLIERNHPELSHSHTHISIEAANLPTARKLHIQRGDMMLKLDALLFSRAGEIVDYSLSYFVPGYFRFHVLRRLDPYESWNGQPD